MISKVTINLAGDDKVKCVTLTHKCLVVSCSVNLAVLLFLEV